MRSKAGGILAACGAGALWFGRGTIESWFFEKVLRVIEPYPTWSWAIEYGPPAALAGLALWLLWRDRSITPQAEKSKISSLETEAKTLDVSEWIGHPTYFVWVASCLWINQRPSRPVHQDHPAYPTLQMIKGHLDTGVLKSVQGGAGADDRLPREELIKLANIRKEKPRFLFPETPPVPSVGQLQEDAHFTHGFDPVSEEARKATILLLARLRTEGVNLRNEAANVVDATLDTWLSDTHKWLDAVLDGLALIDQADAELFRTLDVVGPPRINILVKVVNPDRVHDFIHHYRMHDLRVSRLWDFLQKYQSVTFRRG